MTDDAWFRMLNDDYADLQASVRRTKKAYGQRTLACFGIVLVGVALMGFAEVASAAVVGCFVALTGVAAIMALSVAAHTQLCFFRAIKEMRAPGSTES
jgi:hypothetical protein